MSMDKESVKSLKRSAIAGNVLWLIIILPMSPFMAVGPDYFAIVFMLTVIAIPFLTIRGIRNYQDVKARKTALITNICGAIFFLYSFYSAITYEYLQPPKGMNFIELGANFSFIGVLIIIFNIVVFVLLAQVNNEDNI